MDMLYNVSVEKYTRLRVANNMPAFQWQRKIVDWGLCAYLIRRFNKRRNNQFVSLKAQGIIIYIYIKNIKKDTDSNQMLYIL